jgi:hypothetical protein
MEKANIGERARKYLEGTKDGSTKNIRNAYAHPVKSSSHD